MDAFELLANARDAQNATPLQIYQFLATDGRTYYLVQGLVGVDQSPRYVPEFQLIAASLRRVE